MTEAPSRNDRSIYRILGFDRVVEIFESGQLYFSSPSSWEDPCETRLQHRTSDNLFAQCWCKNGVSDAMWRIYSPNRVGVRIRTTRDKLSEQLGVACRAQGLGLLLRDVQYRKEFELNHELECLADSLAQAFKPSVAARALLFKRLAFRHEAEVRAVIFGEGESQRKLAAPMQLAVKPHELIQSVLVDPRAPDAYVKAYRYYLVEKLGFKGPVQKSGLYADREPLEVL